MTTEAQELRALRRDLESLQSFQPEVLSASEYRLYRDAISNLEVVHDSMAYRVETNDVDNQARIQHTALPDGGPP